MCADDYAWTDVLADEDPIMDFESDKPEAVKTALPDDNEGNPEMEEQDFPAAGDLPEKEDDPGMKDAPGTKEGDATDPNTGEKSGDYDNICDTLMDKDDDEESEDKGDDEDDKSDDDKSDDEEDKGDDEGTKDFFSDDYTDFDEDDGLTDFESDAPGNAKTALPPNKSNPELEEQGQPASGDLPEKDTDPGMKKAGDLGYGQEDYEDICNILTDEDDTKDEGEDKGSDDDGASDDDDVKGDDDEDDKSDDDDEVKDISSFFVDADAVEPEGLPAGSDAEPADPVDQNGRSVCPIGEPNGTKKVNTPEKIPVAGPAKDQFEETDKRFSFFGEW